MTIDGFVQKINIRLETNNFIVKTVETAEELTTVLGLRHDIFHREFRNVELPSGLDIDQYDAICDHLIIQDKSNGKLVGTYRLISSTFSSKFYSQDEFNLDRMLAYPGIKLELGRACIDKSYRSGVVITLLWRGLAQYLREVKADYLFGCSSAKTEDVAIVSAICRHLRTGGFLSDEFTGEPTQAFRMPGLTAAISTPPELGAEAEAIRADEEIAKEWIPSLLTSYLKAGAKICGEPALDRDFKCVDFLTVLRTDQLTKAFERKYQVV